MWRSGATAPCWPLLPWAQRTPRSVRPENLHAGLQVLPEVSTGFTAACTVLSSQRWGFEKCVVCLGAAPLLPRVLTCEFQRAPNRSPRRVCKHGAQPDCPVKQFCVVLTPLPDSGVATGAILGHVVATAIAVLGGAFASQYISEKTIAYIGGVLFLAFAVATALGYF